MLGFGPRFFLTAQRSVLAYHANTYWVHNRLNGFDRNHALDTTMKELVEIAIVAYRAGRYRDAIELLLQVTDDRPDNWLARLYLGMCYEKAGRITDAHRLFKRLAEE